MTDKKKERIFVMSDTHGYIEGVIDYLKDKNFDRIFHLGDHSWDGEEIQARLGRVIMTVKGNNDWGASAPEEMILDSLAGRILLVHGHKHGVYGGVNRLAAYAEFKGCRVALYGHTHVYSKEKVGHILLLNPGSPSLPRDGRASAAILSLEDGEEPVVERVFF